MKIDFKSERSQKQIGYLALIGGLIATSGGIFGIWMQGRAMYSGDPLVNIADVLCPQEIYLSVCLASLAITIGGFSLSWVILGSKLTEKSSMLRRNGLFAALVVVFLAAIMIASKIATGQAWAIAQAASAAHFKNLQTNAPVTLPNIHSEFIMYLGAHATVSGFHHRQGFGGGSPQISPPRFSCRLPLKILSVG